MAELVQGGSTWLGNVAALDSFKDAKVMRFVHAERSSWLIFTSVEGETIYALDCAQFGVIFIFNVTVELSSFDGRVVAAVLCFSDRAPGGNERDLKIIRTDYRAAPEIRFGEVIP